MKKKLVLLFTAICLMGIMTGCGEKTTDLKSMKVEKYVTLPDYKNLEVTVDPKNEVTDDDVEYYIQNVMQQNESFQLMEGVVEDGDVVNIDYSGTIDGEAFDGGTAQGSWLEIGSGSFIDGFETGLIDKNIGETVELELTFPEAYGNAELAGKATVFTVTINSKLGELTDENLPQLDNSCSTVEEYKTTVKEFLGSYADYLYQSDLKSAISTKLMNECTFENIPESLTERFETSLREEYQAAADTAGMDLTSYMTNNYGVTDVDQSFSDAALQCAKESLMLQAIANLEDLNVTDEELDQKLQEYVETSESYESVEDYLGDRDKEDTRESLMYSKVYEFLMDNAVVSSNS